jgi:hypothetical protein
VMRPGIVYHACSRRIAAHRKFSFRSRRFVSICNHTIVTSRALRYFITLSFRRDVLRGGCAVQRRNQGEKLSVEIREGGKMMLASAFDAIDRVRRSLAPGAIMREVEFSSLKSARGRSMSAAQIFFSIRASSANWDSTLVTILKRVYHVPLAASFRSCTESFLRKV